MTKWLENLRQSPVKKAIPILSFPCVQLLEIGVKDLIMDSGLQAKGMKLVADRVDSGACVSMMDLSVEAEAFGAQIRFSNDEVPTVIGHIVEDMESARALNIPPVGAGRTGIYLNAIEEACKCITDRPVLAGVIGPFSLAGRLLDVSEAMLYCYDEPEMVHLVLEKVTSFLIDYARAYRAAGANGLVLAEPLAGLLNPALNSEFSVPYVKKIVDAVQRDDFLVVYHNCGNGVPQLIDGILQTGAGAYHFGNSISMAQMLKLVPESTVIMGNIDPSAQFRGGTPESVRRETLALLQACAGHSNFVISSGCDIPPLSKWENIDAFFAAVEDHYSGRS